MIRFRVRSVAFLSSLVAIIALAPPVWPYVLQEVSHLVPGSQTGLLALSPPPATANEYQIADCGICFDAQSKLWRKWFAVRKPNFFTSGVSICSAHSDDGKCWIIDSDDALSATELNQTLVGTPVVVFNPDAGGSHPYKMWYEVSNAATADDTTIAMAISEDGVKFSPLAAALSPHGQLGMVLSGQDGFAEQRQIAHVQLAEPQVVYKDGWYQIWFAKIAKNSAGEVVAAGVGYARSNNGVNWQTEADSLTLQFDSKRVSSQYLLRRLKHVSVAYSEASTM